MIRHGLISNIDALTIEKTLELILKEFPEGVINTCEVGILDGSTSIGIHDFFTQHGRENLHTGIDNQQYQKVPKPFPECNLIIGDSKYVYNKLEDESQHFIFIDGNHNFPSVVADFFCYESKVIKGGYLGFHDSAPHIEPFTDYQFYGSKDDPDMYISIRKALYRMGLLQSINSPFLSIGWQRIFEDCDPNDTAGGVTIFRKTY